MAKNRKTPDMNLPVWFDGQNINEALFCEEFLQESRIIFANRAFFTPNGRVTDDIVLRGEVYEKLKSYTISSVPQKIKNIMELLKLEAMVEDLPPQPDRIHVANGTLMLDGRFIEGKKEIVQSRLPVSYNPNAAAPALWLNFLDCLLYEEDIPTLQEFIGYCLIPSNKGQRMMVIKGNGGEGKSQIGAVLSTIFGTNMKDGSIGKISENRFARADLEHILLCVDDDMRMEALRQTNYVKSIVTAQGKMDLERKGKQSYQGWMFARLMAFSNGDLQALYDRSDGFYRRQLVLTTKEKPVDRADDPDLAEKMKAEAEGIFLWAFEGLQRLVANNFKFTESDRIRENREAVKRDNNNIFDFMDSEGYIRRKADASISSKDFYAIYRLWCEENSLAPLKSRSFSDAMVANAKKFNLEHCNNITNSAGRRVWGFMGVEAVARPNINGFYDVSPCTYVPEEWQDGFLSFVFCMYVHSVLPVFLFYRNNQLSELTCFRALKINGNGNSKVLDRRTKPFHQIVLLQTMHPVYETMGVFTVSDKIPRNSKVGYMPVWTEYRTHKMKAILEKADFSLFGASAPLWGVAFAPNCKSKASGRLPQNGHPEHLPVSWVRIVLSNLPADADNPSAPGNTAFHPPGTDGYRDALA